MIALLWLLLAILALPFKSKCRLEAENAALQIWGMVPQKAAPSLAGRYTQQAETDSRYHEQIHGSDVSRGGRPQIDAGLRASAVGSAAHPW
jgi:hypothetical protein